MTLVLDVEIAEVTTVEGLAKDGELHPVQEAFIEHDASMCGFCTPGMVMSCAGLARNPQPTLNDVKMQPAATCAGAVLIPKCSATLSAAKR